MSAPKSPYRQLQARAKARGISANQSSAVLEALLHEESAGGAGFATATTATTATTDSDKDLQDITSPAPPSTTGSLWKLKELWILLSGLALVALQMCIDWLTTPPDWPVVISDLDAVVMTKLTGRDVTKVETDEKYSNRKVEDVGAGGTGTSRAWLTLTMADGKVEHVFVKLPTESLGERMFLTVFGVYRNELNFYENIRDQPQFPDDLFAKVHCAKMRGTRFVLVLENIAYRGGVTFPPIIAPYPKDRAELVLRSFAVLHAANWGSPPKGCWTDQWSALQTSPPGTASEGTRPPALRLIFENTLEAVVKRYGFPDDVKATYIKFIENEPVVREFWSQAPLTMCWGDGHYGNMFFREENGVMSQGFYDAQCVAAEHGMRDVCYHLTSAYDPDALERDEVGFVKCYCDTLNPLLAAKGLAPLEFADAWFQYRLHVVFVICAFVVSAGASDLMVEAVAGPVLDRIARAAQRLDSAGALDEVLAAAKSKKFR